MHHANWRRGALLALTAAVALSCSSPRPARDASSPDVGGMRQPDASAGHDTADPGDIATERDATVPPPTEALPAFDEATDAHVRELAARGRALGNRTEVFAKIGDSITESASFLWDCGFGWYTLDAYADLEPTIRYFSTVTFADGRNSFNRPSLAAMGGWIAADALTGDSDSPIAREIDGARPLWAIIMFGTNDLDRSDLGTYSANLARIVELIEARGVVPVLSTIPPRADTEHAASLVPLFNDVVRALAYERHLPLIDYWLALQTIPGHGLGPDGIHPSVYEDPNDSESDSCAFVPRALEHGYNVRNLLAIQMLARLRAY